MDKNLETITKIKQAAMIKAFEQNNMQITFVDNFEQLHIYLQKYLCNQKTVALGGSMTLFEAGVIEQIHQADVILYDRYEEGLTREKMQEIFRKAFTSDLFITSTNALSIDGSLYNIDGNGNRVAAMIYGPKEVIVIAGKNKIFDSEEAAINHIKTVSAPANAVRLNKKTPCTKTGTCMNCTSPERICSSYVKLGYQGNPGRIKIVIVDQDLGY